MVYFWYHLVSSSSSLGTGPRAVKLARQWLVILQQLLDPPPGVVRGVLTEVRGAQRRLLRVLQLEQTVKHHSRLKIKHLHFVLAGNTIAVTKVRRLTVL